jgi:hypothetical protein
MSSTDEKHHADAAAADMKPGSPSSEASEEPIDPVAERRLLMKLDLIIFPVFFVVYMMAFLDRINISNASIQGLSAELDLNRDNRFNVALFVCFLTLRTLPVTPFFCVRR